MCLDGRDVIWGLWLQALIFFPCLAFRLFFIGVRAPDRPCAHKDTRESLREENRRRRSEEPSIRLHSVRMNAFTRHHPSDNQRFFPPSFSPLVSPSIHPSIQPPYPYSILTLSLLYAYSFLALSSLSRRPANVGRTLMHWLCAPVDRFGCSDVRWIDQIIDYSTAFSTWLSFISFLDQDVKQVGKAKTRSQDFSGRR